jgi:hypothetical protein
MKQWPAPLRPTGSAAQVIAYPALMRNKMLCHLKAGPFAARVFHCRHPWLGEEGTLVSEICRKAGISQTTYFNWKKKLRD